VRAPDKVVPTIWFRSDASPELAKGSPRGDRRLDGYSIVFGPEGAFTGLVARLAGCLDDQ
jgi:hypothetical protein